MSMINIGIIEDVSDEIYRIKRTIFFELDDSIKNDLSYTSYDFNKSDFETVLKKIISDIFSSKISLLIIDNKILSENGLRYSGTNLYEKIRSIFQNFPMIIMTNYKEEAYESFYVDPDKVYDKRQFFSGGIYTKEKVNFIIMNINRYNELKKKALTGNENAIKAYIDNSDPDMEYQLINDIMKNEQELDKYTPVDTSYLEKVISLQDIKEIVRLVDEIMKKVE